MIDIGISRYNLWTIGITTRPNTRKEEHVNPKSWRIWQANSLMAVQNTESHFIKLGMSGGPEEISMTDLLSMCIFFKFTTGVYQQMINANDNLTQDIVARLIIFNYEYCEREPDV